MSSRFSTADVFGRFPIRHEEEAAAAAEEDELERVASAESWILSGGSWKKRKEAAEAKARATSPMAQSSPTASPYRNRSFGKRQPSQPSFQQHSALSSSSVSTSSSSRTILRRGSTGKEPTSSESIASNGMGDELVLSRTSSRLSEASSRASTVDTRKSVRTSQTEPLRSISPRLVERLDAAGFGLFQRSSSALSGAGSRASSTAETRRSSRTSQTDPGQATSTAPIIASIPQVVEEKKRRKNASSRVKPAHSWLKEKDDFFSATRHSESVTRSSRSPVAGQASVEVSEMEETNENWAFQSQDDNFDPFHSSPPTETGRSISSPRTQQTSFISDARSVRSVSQRGRSGSWGEEKKEAETLFDEPTSISSVLSQEPVLKLSLSARAKELRKQRARSITPGSLRSGGRRRSKSPLLMKHRNVSPDPTESSSLSTPRTKVRNVSPVPDSKKDVMSAKDLLASAEEHHVDDDTTNPEGLPLSHVTLIRQSFGFDCDIYKDVLRVGRGANERQLRIAYFRRGRSVLAEHQQRVKATQENTPAHFLRGLSEETKGKFQAVSLAYEIVNRKKWRDLYDAHGWDAPLVDHRPVRKGRSKVQRVDDSHGTQPDEKSRSIQTSQMVEPRSRSTTPILRPSVGTQDERRSRSAGRGIRWSEQVEELVFRQDPDEMMARKVRESPILEFNLDEECIPDDTEGEDSSFMANLLNDIDQSLDGLEASLDGMISAKFNSWNLTTNTSKEDASDQKGERGSPSTTETDESDSQTENVLEDETVPSKLSEKGQRQALLQQSAGNIPEGWNIGGGTCESIPSTISPDEDSEDATVHQLFVALTQTTDERKRREESAHNPLLAPKVSADRLSPSDVKTMPGQEDEVDRAFSNFGKDYGELPIKKLDDDYFNPFDSSSVQIGDTDFCSPSDGKERDMEAQRQKTLKQRQARDSEEFDQILDNALLVSEHQRRRRKDVGRVQEKLKDPVDSRLNKVSARHETAESTSKRTKEVVTPPPMLESTTRRMAPGTPLNAQLFSNNLPEFQHVAPVQTIKADNSDSDSFRRAHSGISTLTGTLSSYNSSVKTETVLNQSSGNHFCSPVTGEVPMARVQSATKDAHPQVPVKQQAPEEPPKPCDSDFLSHLFCYAGALSNDLSTFGSHFSEETNKALAATQAMIIESLTFSDENVKGMVSAMDIPGVERSNTI